MTRRKTDPTRNSDATQELRAYVERLEVLEEQKRDIADDIKALKGEIRGRGYEVKSVERIVKERAEDDTKRARRREIEAITDLYRAALGMLDGTPLGEAARERLSQPPEPRADDDKTPYEPPAPKPALTTEDIDAAREAGRQGRRDHKRVIDNPFVAGDPRRAAWDEGWCTEAGSDGMDIPPAWRRAEKKKPRKSDDDHGGEDDDQ